MMPIVEEYSRECLALKTERSITAEDGGRDSGQVVHRARSAELHPLTDNGPEFIAKAVKRWLAAFGVETL